MGVDKKHEYALVAGLASLLAVVDFLLWGGAFTMHDCASTFTSEEIRVFYTVPGMVVLGLGLILGPAVLARKPRLQVPSAVLGCVCMLAADVALGVLHVMGARLLGALALAGVATGVGVAASLLAWRSVLANLSRHARTGVVSAACLAFPFVPLVLSLVRSSASFVVVGVLCVLALVPALRFARHPCASEADGAPSRRATLPVSAQGGAPAILCLVSLGFVAGLARTSALSSEAGSGGIMWGSLACMFAIALALLVTWRVLGRAIGVVRFYQAGFALTATALVVSLVFAHGFTAVLACLPYLVLEFALALVMVEGADEGVVGLCAFGVQTGAAYLALALGTALGLALCHGEGGASAAFSLTIALCVYALSIPLVVMLRRREPAPEAAHPGSAAPQPVSALEPRDIYAARAHVLADEYGLTPREEQIVVLTACGLDSPALARELGVSDNTVRTHKRNAYKKLGAHSKQDVLAMLSREPATYACEGERV